MDGFHQVGERAGLERDVNLFVAGKRRERDDFGVRILGANRADGIGAAQIGQPEIHQRHVRPAQSEQLDGVVTGGGFRAYRHVGLERDDAGQPEADEVVIVDEHEPNRVVIVAIWDSPRETPGRGSRRLTLGTVTATTAPPSGWFSSRSVPPILSTRSRMPRRPKWPFT